MAKEFTYKSSGVDIEAGDHFVSSITDLVKQTHRKEVLSDIGGFGGLFEPDFSQFKRPVLVSSTDGVGTKLIVAFKAGVYHTVSQDLVNHCVNDIAVCGAEPLFFLDYFSTGKLEQKMAHDVLRGFTIACRENGCALIGGETAEMPDLYKPGEFDLAGTITGVVDKERIINGSRTEKGDIIIGIGGNGLHTNGYSLARNVLFKEFEIDAYIDELQMTLAESLLHIHPSYLNHIRAVKENTGVKAFAHITGGGIEGNTRRVIPEGCTLKIDWNSWQRPALFRLIQNTGHVPEEDMRKTFNLGIGLTVVVSPESAESVLKTLQTFPFESIKIGMVV